MSENLDYNLVRQYLILSEVHIKGHYNNYYEDNVYIYHQNTTNVLLQYMENRWFQDTRIDRLVCQEIVCKQPFTRARELAHPEI